MRLLVLDAYPREDREALQVAGGTAAGELYRRVLAELAPGARIDIAYAADRDDLPGGTALGDYAGLVWTGSSLTIHVEGDRRVRRQVELARAAFREGVPAFGSCWAAQLAAVAAGGRCAANPKGREFGVGRQIEPTAAGRAHPLLRGREGAFDAFTSHADEVVELPPGATLLASNAFSRVQALAVAHERGEFWAVQYHPEYDCNEIAALTRMRFEELVAQGRFASREEALAFAERSEQLHRDGSRRDLARDLGIEDELLDPAQRLREVANWLAAQIEPCANA